MYLLCVSGCPLCPANGMVDVIADRGIAYLVAPKVSPIEDCYLIVPRSHVTDMRMLPDTWQVAVSHLLNDVPWFIPDVTPFNFSLNVGRPAGQTLSHLHFWVIPRNEDEGSSSYGQGAATLVQRLNMINT